MDLLTKHTCNSFVSWYRSANDIGGGILIDKDLSWTSFDVVAKLRNVLKIKKIGHAGTLDPLATGLLIVNCGKATKSIDEFQNLSKEYVATIKLGATTQSDDREFPEENQCSTSHLSESDIRKVIDTFVGEIDQVPPMFSARKVEGKRLYALARKGRTVERGSSKVTIHSIEVIELNDSLTSLRICCSKGTYIRSLARDIGYALGVGGYLYSLRRTMIGTLSVDDALTIQNIIEAASNLTTVADQLEEV